MNEDKADDLVSVLRNLGYKAVEAKKRAKAVLDKYEEEVSLEVLIKEALAWTASYKTSENVSVKTLTSVEPDETETNDVFSQKCESAIRQRKRQEELAEQPAQAADGGGGGLTFLVVVGILVGLVVWIGVVRFLMGLAAILVFLYLVGKYVESREA